MRYHQGPSICLGEHKAGCKKIPFLLHQIFPGLFILLRILLYLNVAASSFCIIISPSLQFADIPICWLGSSNRLPKGVDIQSIIINHLRHSSSRPLPIRSRHLRAEVGSHVIPNEANFPHSHLVITPAAQEQIRFVIS